MKWFEDEKEISSVQVKTFEKMCKEMYAQKEIVDTLKASEKKQSATLTKMKTKIVLYMEDFGKTKYVTNHGTIFVQDKFSVKVPKEPEQKALFFKWLEERGIKDRLTTVASPTLNSLYKEELAASGDPDFKIPGIADPTSYKLLQIRSK